MVMVQTSLGALRDLVSRLDGRMVTIALEFDGVRRTARDRDLTVRDALEQTRAAGRRRFR
jgi:hypothetical protein